MRSKREFSAKITLFASMQCSSAMNERKFGHSLAIDDNNSLDKHSVLQRGIGLHATKPLVTILSVVSLRNGKNRCS